MNLIKQPNRWSCLLCSAAMVIDMSYEKALAQVGHDGSEVWWPELPDSQCRRSFHIQEIIDLGRTFFGSFMPIEASPSSRPYGYVLPKPLWHEDAAHSRMSKALERYSGILILESIQHAVAWDVETQQIYNPNGTIHAIDGLAISELWAWC